MAADHFPLQVYIAELDESVDVCVERNTHNRTKEEIEKVRTCTYKTHSVRAYTLDYTLYTVIMPPRCYAQARYTVCVYVCVCVCRLLQLLKDQ